ncbi:hypothetical protein NM688_g8181 [Phlebia brevispora]|uniref:Uncharacterized protein n=1 Tax=Phlebia brevispora TaxID=194682 RepID=A0ACC1RW71_9APHY|nr:hypothetical protein NM688_g8181 [Phlebia brevispora]
MCRSYALVATSSWLPVHCTDRRRAGYAAAACEFGLFSILVPATACPSARSEQLVKFAGTRHYLRHHFLIDVIKSSRHHCGPPQHWANTAQVRVGIPGTPAPRALGISGAILASNASAEPTLGYDGSGQEKHLPLPGEGPR